MSRPASREVSWLAGRWPMAGWFFVELTIEDNPALHRFEARTGDQVAGFVAYRLRPGARVLTHTEVDPAYAGQGVGSQLAQGVLEVIRAEGGKVVPQCPFVAAYLKRHPEYQDLVAAD